MKEEQEVTRVALDDLSAGGVREAFLKCELIPLSSPLFAEARRREELRQARLAGELVEAEEEPEENESLPAFPEIAWRGTLKTYREAMQGTTEASEVHHFAALWTAAAARLQRRVRMSYGMTLYPNVYLVSFGPTGDRKTTAARGALSLLPDSVPVKVLQGVGSGEGLSDWLSTDGAAPVSHLLFLEELGELLARGKWDGATLLSFLTHVFDCPSKYELKFRKNPVSLTEPTLSLSACTTPALFWQHMREVDIHGGFGNRLLYLTGPVKESLALPGKPDFHKLSDVNTSIARLDTSKAQEATLSLEAQTLWGEFYKAWRGTELDQLTKAATERVPAYCLKLAMVYAALEQTLPRITVDQLKAAVAVGRYATKCAEALMSHNRQPVRARPMRAGYPPGVAGEIILAIPPSTLAASEWTVRLLAVWESS